MQGSKEAPPPQKELGSGSSSPVTEFGGEPLSIPRGRGDSGQRWCPQEDECAQARAGKGGAVTGTSPGRGLCLFGLLLTFLITCNSVVCAHSLPPAF